MELPAASFSRVSGGGSGMAETKVGSIHTPEAKKFRISTKSTPEKEARVVGGGGADYIIFFLFLYNVFRIRAAAATLELVCN